MLEFYRRLAYSYGSLGLAAKVSIVLAITVVTSVFGIIVIVSVPADQFTRMPSLDSWWRKHSIVRWTGLFLKNALGLLVLPMGIVMALPLVPGPGLVFVLIGLSLLDFPGKRRLERLLLERRAVLRFLNDMRARFDKPPLLVPPRPPRK